MNAGPPPVQLPPIPAPPSNVPKGDALGLVPRSANGWVPPLSTAVAEPAMLKTNAVILPPEALVFELVSDTVKTPGTYEINPV